MQKKDSDPARLRKTAKNQALQAIGFIVFSVKTLQMLNRLNRYGLKASFLKKKEHSNNASEQTTGPLEHCGLDTQNQSGPRCSGFLAISLVKTNTAYQHKNFTVAIRQFGGEVMI